MNMKHTPLFTGVCTALVTPFHRGEVNYPMLQQLLKQQLEAGIRAVVICGTTGEAPTLSDREKLELFRKAKEYVGDRCLILAGTGSNDTRHAMALSRAAEQAGADGLLLVSPYYNKATPEGLTAHYRAIAGAVEIPCIVYNVPSRTGLDIPVSVYRELAKIPNIAGIKDAGGNMSKTMETLRLIRNKCDLYSGEDALNFPILAVGGVGVISVLSNLVPAEVKKLCSLVLEGKFAEAATLNDKLLPLANACFVEVNPIPAKEAMNLLGYACGTPRAPLSVMEEGNREKLIKAMQDFGLEVKA
jgi:4-hydroxy-tetrahydrodipicolinate synthase